MLLCSFIITPESNTIAVMDVVAVVVANAAVVSCDFHIPNHYTVYDIFCLMSLYSLHGRNDSDTKKLPQHPTTYIFTLQV